MKSDLRTSGWGHWGKAAISAILRRRVAGAIAPDDFGTGPKCELLGRRQLIAPLLWMLPKYSLGHHVHQTLGTDLLSINTRAGSNPE